MNEGVVMHIYTPNADTHTCSACGRVVRLAARAVIVVVAGNATSTHTGGKGEYSDVAALLRRAGL